VGCWRATAKGRGRHARYLIAQIEQNKNIFMPRYPSRERVLTSQGFS
jgi:hypothetical protein